MLDHLDLLFDLALALEQDSRHWKLPPVQPRERQEQRHQCVGHTHACQPAQPARAHAISVLRTLGPASKHAQGSWPVDITSGADMPPISRATHLCRAPVYLPTFLSTHHLHPATQCKRPTVRHPVQGTLNLNKVPALNKVGRHQARHARLVGHRNRAGHARRPPWIGRARVTPLSRGTRVTTISRVRFGCWRKT